MLPKTYLRSLVIIFALFITQASHAWIYPEHRRIALLAIQKLSPEHRAALDKLWGEARRKYTGRLTESVIAPDQGRHPTQLDFASWTAIAGDHSCSPRNMLDNVLNSDWILRVADIAAKLAFEIKTAKIRAQQINAIRDSDIRLQRADVEYATRAGSNNVHFLQARPQVSTTAHEYLESCNESGVPINAVGVYSWFHSSAMNKAARYANESLDENEKSALILAALADEAFALHFLEDVYAAGHAAGTWGATAMRKGTHDFYNEKGLEMVTWDGTRVISLGDAFMREDDANLAAENIGKSLEQLIKAATGEWKVDYQSDPRMVSLPDTLNVCTNNKMFVYGGKVEPTEGIVSIREYLPTVLMKTPVPGLANGLGEIPRFRSELGMFLGISGSVDGTSIDGGFGKEQKERGIVRGIEANVRFGFGLDGVLNQSGDGLVFLQAGLRVDASSTNKFDDYSTSIPPGAQPAAIPGRPGFNFRLRVPFWLVPGDLLIAGPFLYIFNRKALTKMAVGASNGGLIPWQSGIATSIGRFQFILGREVGVTFYDQRESGILIAHPGGSTYISYSSTKFDFPFFEYRPFRTFSMDQTSSLILQFTGGFDIPRGGETILPVGEPVPELKPVWHVGVRVIFDWRHYF